MQSDPPRRNGFDEIQHPRIVIYFHDGSWAARPSETGRKP